MRAAFVGCLFAAALCAQDATLVSGFVLDQVHGSGILDVRVQLFSQTGGRANQYLASTDATGQFIFRGVPSGDYVATVAKSGYSVPNTEIMASRRIHVASTSDPIMLRFELIPPASLRGQVLGPDGEPAKDVWVDMGRKTEAADDQGNFVFDPLTPGPVTLVAYPKNPKPTIAPDGTRTEIVPTYYPSAIDRALAESIDLKAGTDLTGYQIHLQTAVVNRVRGIVADPSGKPLSKVIVTLISRIQGGSGGSPLSLADGPFTVHSGISALSPSPADPVVTGNDGVFEFPSVIEGDWLLRAESDNIRDEVRKKNVVLMGGLSIRVNRRDLDDLQIALLPPFDMKGSVEMADGSPVPKNLAVGTAVFSGDIGGSSGRAIMRSDASFVVEDVRPGRSTVLASLGSTTASTGSSTAPDGVMVFPVGSRDYYVGSILLGNSNITGQVVDLAPTSPALRVILKPAGKLNGHVENCGKSTVLLVPRNVMDGGEGWRASCGSDGNFQFRGLPPGDYSVRAVDNYDIIVQSELTQLRDLMQRATSVHVDEGSVTSVDLKVVK